MTYVSSTPDREPNIEVFWCGLSAYGPCEWGPGWYWWACFPGCLPDSDAHGPFQTEQEATLDAQSGD